jgi:hypothetical protein
MILSSPASKSNSVPATARMMEQGIWFVTLMLHILMGVLVAVGAGVGGRGVGVSVGTGVGVAVGGGATVGVAVGV